MIRIFFIITIFLNISHAHNYIEASEYENYLKNNIISRAQWKSYPCKPGMKKELKKTKFAIHHSASNAAPAYNIVKNIQHAHINDKKWSDIGYHFLIDIEGNCFEGRELCFQGAHVEGNNKENIGICFLGCFDEHENNFHQPQEVMFDKAAELIGVLSRKFSIIIDENSVRAHCKYKNAHTICPGNLVLNKIEEIILKAKQS